MSEQRDDTTMKRYLLAAVAAVALGGSANAQSNLDAWRNVAPGGRAATRALRICAATHAAV